MVNFKNFLFEESQEEYASLLDELIALLTSEGAVEFFIKDESHTIEVQGEDYIERKDGEIVKSQKLYKDGEVTNYDLAISRLKDAIKAVKAGNVIAPEEPANEALEPKQKLFKEMLKMSSQLNKYAHRWGENPSQRMMGWVDTYNDNKEKMQKDGTWEEYCKLNGFSKSHNGYDCLA